jgi:hypothetical protein
MDGGCLRRPARRPVTRRRTTARSREADMRTMFTAYLLTIVVGLAYFLLMAVRHV